MEWPKEGATGIRAGLSADQEIYMAEDVRYLIALHDELLLKSSIEEKSVYWKACHVIRHKLELEFSGYTDLLSYPQNDRQTALKLRRWFIQNQIDLEV